MAKIIGSQLANTGGGCMVLELLIVGHDDVKSITINEELIVARSVASPTYCGEEELYHTDDWNELIISLGVKLTKDVRKRFAAEWRWSDCLINEHIIDAYIHLENAVEELRLVERCWNDELENAPQQFPYDKCFSEAVDELQAWQKQLEKSRG